MFTAIRKLYRTLTAPRNFSGWGTIHQDGQYTTYGNFVDLGVVGNNQELCEYCGTTATTRYYGCGDFEDKELYLPLGGQISVCHACAKGQYVSQEVAYYRI